MVFSFPTNIVVVVVVYPSQNKQIAVQEERQRSRDSLEVEVESSNMHNDIPLARIVEAEVKVDRLVDYDNSRLPYNLKSNVSTDCV